MASRFLCKGISCLKLYECIYMYACEITILIYIYIYIYNIYVYISLYVLKAN